MIAEQIVFLPGVNGLGEFWSPVAAAMTNPSSKVLLDLPGLGHAPAEHGINSFDDLLAMVLMKIDRPTALVAQSMGGVIAMRAALANPSLVTHLVLAATSGGVDITGLGGTDWKPSFRANHPHAPLWSYEPVADLSASLPDMRVPTLLVWAARDTVSPLAVGEHLRSLLPDARLVSYDSEDHWVAQSRAGEVASEIDAHLAR